MAKLKKKLDEEEEDLIDDSDEVSEEDGTIGKKKRRTEEVISDALKARRVRDDFNLKIKHNHDSKMVKLLRTRGVSSLDIMHGTKSFNLEDVVQPISSQSQGKVKKINVQKQLNWYESSYKRVLGQSWLSAGIGGFPSDARAKQIALHMFLKAIQEYQQRDPRKNHSRSLPFWHHVYGGFGDNLRDMKTDFPSFVVISNITSECTALKMEKVRDALVKFNNLNIPVLIVCAGIDPFTLFTTKLFYPMQWGLSVGNPFVQL